MAAGQVAIIRGGRREGTTQTRTMDAAGSRTNDEEIVNAVIQNVSR